jgi:hypothetical protein
MGAMRKICITTMVGLFLGATPGLAGSVTTTTASTTTTLAGGTSTTTTVGGSTTTTTQLGECPTTPPIDGIVCQLHVLVQEVTDASSELGKFEKNALNGAMKALTNAETVQSSSSKKTQKEQLKRCRQNLQSFSHRLNSLNARKKVPLSTRNLLTTHATMILSDVTALRKSL